MVLNTFVTVLPCSKFYKEQIILTFSCSCNEGEFATQTCFQGRFGEEAGSDQFGGCIMFHAPRPNENLAIGRLEYVEVIGFQISFQKRLGSQDVNNKTLHQLLFYLVC